MGVVKDGTVSGILPENVGFAVHYPGYPSSTSRAIETLGGSEGILKTRSVSSEPLELRFRPEDPYSHPAFGYLRPCSNLLLKISKQKINGDQDVVLSKRVPECSLTNQESSESTNCLPENVNNPHESTVPDNALNAVKKDNQPRIEEAELVELSADIVARVSEAYHFNGMVDYQHVVAVHAQAGKNKNKKRDRAEVEPYSEKGPMDIDQEDVMILVPPLFSLKDVPEKIVLKPSATINSKKKLEAIVEQRWEMQIEPCLAIDFNIKEIPRKVNWEDHITRGSDQWNLQMAVSTLFDERPIWPTLSLNHHLLDKVSFESYRLLFRTAYYFSTGPYRRLWIRKGYDPRKDPESRVYQRIDFRVPPPLRYIDENSTDKLKRTWKDLCTFHVFPCKSQISLQLFELVDDYIQEAIRKPPEETCSVKVPVYTAGTDTKPSDIAKQGLQDAKKKNADVVIVDTAGRLQIDKAMMDELKEVKRAVNPTEVLLVVDAMTGQEAAGLVTAFNLEIGITGAILTKLDGDSRGGAALSVREVSGKPIKLVGRGERMEDLEPFYPDRMAGRILGMGDVLSFVEKAQEVMRQEDAEDLQKKIMSTKFDFNDFLKQTRAVAQMGSMSRVLGMIPGMGKVTPAQIREAEKSLKIMEGMIEAMTPEEREKPELLAESSVRRKRVAQDSGKTEQQVSQLVSQLFQMRVRMKNLMGVMQGGSIPALNNLEESLKAEQKAPPGTARRKRKSESRRQFTGSASARPSPRGFGTK